jgi:hypothetical protein
MIICRLFQTPARLIWSGALFAPTHTTAFTQRSILSLCPHPLHWRLLLGIKFCQKNNNKKVPRNTFLLIFWKQNIFCMIFEVPKTSLRLRWKFLCSGLWHRVAACKIWKKCLPLSSEKKIMPTTKVTVSSEPSLNPYRTKRPIFRKKVTVLLVAGNPRKRIRIESPLLQRRGKGFEKAHPVC